MRVMLLGGTDLTLAVAERLREMGQPPTAVVHVGQRFSISYHREGVINSRHANMAGWCESHGIRHKTYTDPDSIRTLQAETHCDFALAAGWYHMVPVSIRRLFPKGVAGIHHSLLPKLRGGAPLNWAILSGEREAGTSIFLLGDGVDDGPLLAQKSFPLDDTTKIGDLVKMAEQAALSMLPEVIEGLATGQLLPMEQVGEPSYCLQRIPDDGRIRWTDTAASIDRLIRATGAPYPGAWTTLSNERLIIFEARIAEDAPLVLGAPGQIFVWQRRPLVVTGDRILEVVQAVGPNGDDMIPTLLRSNNQRCV